jgi:uncharacterized membrane protein YdbT with pleckstrin-like domain
MDDSEGQLAPGEQVVLRARPHPVVFGGTLGFTAFVVGAVWLIIVRNELTTSAILQLCLGAAAIVLIGFVSPLLRWWHAECLVTNRRLVLRAGLFRPRTRALALPAIEDVGVDESMMGRLLGYGTLHVVGGDGTVDVFPRVQNVRAVRDAIARQVPRSGGRRR